MSEVVHKAGGVALRPITGIASAVAGIAAGATFFISGSTLAAEQTAAPAEEELTEVTVTGSRIAQAVGMSTPTPVTALTAEELTAIAPTSITQALTQLPQFAFSATAENFGGASNGFFASPGGGSLNLRGVGAKRTLTLLDSRRVVPATAYGGPDINMFPDQMLKRVEAVTGGASAAYGTDAVSGVVNYILDTHFNGVRASAQTGFTDRRDGNNSKYSIAFGTDLGERSHLLFAAGYDRQSEIVGYQGRDWYKGCGLMSNPNVPASVVASNPATWIPGNGGYDLSTPRVVPGCDMHSTQLTYDGFFQTGTGAGVRRYELQDNGNVIPYVRLGATGSAAGSTVQFGGGGENFGTTDTTVLPFSSRKNVFAYLDHDLSENVNVYFQGMYGEQTLRTFGRVGDFNSSLNQAITIFRDNAYLPADVARVMDTGTATPLTSITFTRAGTSKDWGRGSFANISQTTGLTLGMKSKLSTGGFMDGWGIDSYVQYGKNDLDAAQEGGIRLDRFYLATDAVIDPVTKSVRCRVTVVSGLVPDCVPLNVFGRNNASTAAVNWVKGFDPDVAVTTRPFIGYASDGKTPMYGDPYSYVGDEDKHRIVSLEQKVFEVSANGKVASGWAGDITAALGAHWRKESVDQKVQASQGNSAADPTYRPVWCNDNQLTTANCVAQLSRGNRPPGAIGVQGVPGNPSANSVETQFSNVPFIAGSFTVKELFSEVLVPLVPEMPWLHSLNFQGSLRWADYAGSGSIWSWKGGLDAAFTDEIRLRGTYSRDTRAANISERFDRTGGLTAPVVDKSITPLPAAVAVTTVNGGNPDVSPEQADTFTVGMVYRPNWLSGFDISVDWLRVSLKDAIEQLLAQRVIDLCYEQGDQSQCSRITRDQTTNAILFIPQTFQNLSKANVEAIDVEFGYTHGIHLFGGSEHLGLRVFGSYTLENSVTSATGVKTERASALSLQNMKKKANATLNYSNGPFKWNLQARYLSGGNLNETFNTRRTNATFDHVIYDVADDTVGASVYWDTRLGYDIPLQKGTLELFGNVTNLLDRDPPQVLVENLSSQVGGGYDQLGRRYVLGFNLKF